LIQLNKIEQNKVALNKLIEDNERASETVQMTLQNAQVPESVKTTMLAEMRAHILSLQAQMTKWNTHQGKVKVIAGA
jgi:hypothetical protein